MVGEMEIVQPQDPRLELKMTTKNPIWKSITDYISDNDIRNIADLKASGQPFCAFIWLEPWAKKVQDCLNMRNCKQNKSKREQLRVTGADGHASEVEQQVPRSKKKKFTDDNKSH